MSNTKNEFTNLEWQLEIFQEELLKLKEKNKDLCKGMRELLTHMYDYAVEDSFVDCMAIEKARECLMKNEAD